MTRTYDQLFIGTTWQSPSTDGVLEVTSPATGEVVARVAETTAEDVDRMVAAARESFDEGTWRRTPPAERAKVLAKVADLIEERREDMCDALSDEMGAPLATADMIQILPSLGALRYCAELADEFPFTELREGGLGTSVVTRHPVGVVAAITAWNVPLYLATAKLAPALLAGCSVVLKPSSSSPVNALLLADYFREAGLPEGVLSVVTGRGAIGDHLTSHPEVDKISFTGSTEIGVHIGEIAARHLKRCSLELGGKSAAIVLEDADIESAAGSLVFGALMNSGQACVSQNRVLVHSSRKDEVVKAMTDTLAFMPTGDPKAEGTAFGPLANHAQKTIVEDYIRIGKEEGATVAFGDEPVAGLPESMADGAFVAPTIFTDVDNSMRIAQEEIFGPVIEVITFDTEEEAIRIANDSNYGLAGAIYTADPDKGLDIARQIRTGTFGINWYAFDPSAPFGGFKASGLGRENGPEGLETFCELQSVLMSPGWEPKKA